MSHTDPYNQPASHVIVDLINLTLHKQFAYDAVDVESVQDALTQRPYLQAGAIDYTNIVRETAACDVLIDGHAGTLRVRYNKLYLQRAVRHATLVGTVSDYTPDSLLTAFQDKYRILLESEDTDVALYGNPVIEESFLDHNNAQQGGGTHYRARITPHTSHLAWSGDLDIKLVPATHIALSLPRVELPGKLLLQELPSMLFDVLFYNCFNFDPSDGLWDEDVT